MSDTENCVRLCVSQTLFGALGPASPRGSLFPEKGDKAIGARPSLATEEYPFTRNCGRSPGGCMIADLDGQPSPRAVTREGCVDFAPGTGIQNLGWQSDVLAGRSYLTQVGFRICSVAWIDENSHAIGPRHHVSQQSKTLCGQLDCKKICAGRISIWPTEAGDKTNPTINGCSESKAVAHNNS